MLKKAHFLALLFFGLLPNIVMAKDAAQTEIRVTPAHARCIADNISTYLASGIEPVVIVPRTCPELASTDDILAALAPQNSAGALPEPKVGESDAALIMLRSELECFGRLVVAGDLTVGADGLIMVNLANCDNR